MSKETFKKYFGKVVISLILLGISVYTNYTMYHCMTDESKSYSGVVLGKDIGMTTGKYPKQYWVISFKYDDPVLGTEDINVTYSTYNRLNTGDRTSFKVSEQEYKQHQENGTWYELYFMFCILYSLIFDIVICSILMTFIVAVLVQFWKGEY